MKRTAALLPWLTGVCVSLFYLCFHSTFYNFDGVACAIAVELGDLRHLTHGNHLAYGLLALAWTRCWHLLGYAGPALTALQTLDSLLGGLGAGLFCRLLLRRLRLTPAAAAAASAGLALSYAWWLWSLEAQVYLLGAVFLILAADAALAEEPDPWATGAYHALAILGHVGNAMFVFCAAFLLWRPARLDPPSPRASWLPSPRTAGDWLRYAVVLAAVLLAAYAAAALWCVQPRDARDWRLWLLGSAALGLDRSFIWFTGTPAQNASSWLLMTLRIFTEPLAAAWPWSALGWVLGGSAVAAAAAGLRGWSRAAKACLLWMAGFALLYHSWQPFTMVYRITDLVPFWMLAGLWAAGAPRRARVLAGWALAAGLFNLVFLILPQTDPGRNADYQEALEVSRRTPPDAWVVVNGRGQVYIPYFAGRKPLNLRYYHQRPEALSRRLDELAAEGAPVFISSATLRESGWADFFGGLGVSPVPGSPGSMLYRIGRNGKPSGSRMNRSNTAPAARKGPKGTGSSMRRSPLTTRPTP